MNDAAKTALLIALAEGLLADLEHGRAELVRRRNAIAALTDEQKSHPVHAKRPTVEKMDEAIAEEDRKIAKLGRLIAAVKGG